MEKYWFEQDKKEVHKFSFRKVDELYSSMAYQYNQMRYYLNLYYNRDGFFDNSEYAFALLTGGILENNQLLGKMTINLTQNIPDTIKAKIAKNNPKPEFLTYGGDFKLKKRAKTSNNFIMGQFYKTKIFDIMPDVFLDSMRVGTGFLRVYSENKQIKIKKVSALSIYVDDSEAFTENAKSLHYEDWYDKYDLIRKYPKFKKEIEAAETSIPKNFGFLSSKLKYNLVRVVESWHLPTGKDQDDGIHTVCISNATVLNEKYDRDHFPFVKLDWNSVDKNFFGQGLIEQIERIQCELNLTLMECQKAMHLLATPKYFINIVSKINPDFLDSSWDGNIVPYEGQPPTYFAPPPLSQQFISYMEWVYEKCYNVSGASESFATGTKAAGLDSGIAQREYNDIQTERFIIPGKKYENSFLDAARLYIEEANHIVSLCENCDNLEDNCKCDKFKNTKLIVNSTSNSSIFRIDWNDVKLEDQDYEMRMTPASMLSNTFAGKLQDVQDLQALGVLQPQQVYQLIDFPDTDAANRINLAPFDLIQETLEGFLGGDKYTPPNDFDNLQLIMQEGVKYVALGRLLKCKPDDIEKVQQYITETQSLIEQQQQQAQQQQMAAQAQAQAMTAPQPGQTQNQQVQPQQAANGQQPQ